MTRTTKTMAAVAAAIAMTGATSIMASADSNSTDIDPDFSRPVVGLPRITEIEVGDYNYKITKGIGMQNLSGISPRMLLVPSEHVYHSNLKITMSDGAVLLAYQNGMYVRADQVTLLSALK